MRTKDVIKNWTSRKWHKYNSWKSGTGKFIKRMMNKKIRQEGKQ